MKRDIPAAIQREIARTKAVDVQYCSDCGSPVVNAEGALEAHRYRVHKPLAPAAQIEGVKRWELQWRES